MHFRYSDNWCVTLSIKISKHFIVGSHSLCSWASLNEAIQDQSVLTHVFYVTILIMCNIRAHLLTLAKMVTLPRLVQNCFKERNVLLER